MAIAALTLYLLWFVVAFGLRTAIALRHTGDASWRGVSGRPLTLEWWAGTLFTVALAIGVAAPIADRLGMPLLFDVQSLRLVGLAVAVGGIGLTFAAQLAMGDSWRIGVDESERTVLVTGGAFSLARNPIFTAMAITAVGLGLMVPNLVALVGLVAFVAALELQVRGVEEPYLEAVHGAGYLRYASQVGRFVPGVGRTRPPAR